MAKQIHLILGVSILVLGVILCTGVLQGDEGFKVQLTQYQIEARDAREAIDNLNKALDKEKGVNISLNNNLTSITDPDKIISRLYAITNSNYTINNINAEIFNRLTKFAKAAQKEADKDGTQSSNDKALFLDKSSASAGDLYSADAAKIVMIAKTLAEKADTIASTAKLAYADIVKAAKLKQAELEDFNKKYNTTVSARASAKSTYRSVSNTYNDAVLAYKKALDTQKTNKPSKILDEAVTNTLSRVDKLKKELDKADKDLSDAIAKEKSSYDRVKLTDKELSKLSRISDILSSRTTVAAQCAKDMTRVLSNVTAFSVNASAAAASTNASVKAKVEALNKAAAAKAAEVASALAAKAAQSDPSKKAAAKIAEEAAIKAKSDAAIADALSKKADADKAAAAKAAKDKAETAAKQAAAEKEASDAKIAAAKAEAVAAAKAAAKKAEKDAADAKALSDKMARDAEDARKRAAKAKQDAENADAETKTIALEKAARLQKQAEEAAKQAKLSKEAYLEAKVDTKEAKDVARETKKDTADKKEEMPKTMDQLAKDPSKQPTPVAPEKKNKQQAIIINNVIPQQLQQPAPHDKENTFLSSTVGSFIGAGFGSLLGTSASLALHDSKLHEELRAGISAPPNSRNMGRYMDQHETQWTRGGQSTSRRYSDPYNYILEVNEDDPEVVRWPGKHLEPVNLFMVEDEEKEHGHHSRHHSKEYRHHDSKNKRHSGECHKSCGCTHPLNRSFNVEHDKHRK
jgi:hypothetical protein